MDLEEAEKLYGERTETLPRIIRENYEPPERYRKKEIRRMIEHALAACSHSQRIAVFLVDYQGFTGKEAAEIMGIKPGSVSNYRNEAKKRMVARLKKFGYKEKPRGGPKRKRGRLGRWEMSATQRQKEDEERTKWQSR